MKFEKIIKSITYGYSFRERVEEDPLGDIYVLQAKDVQINNLSKETAIKIKAEDVKEKFILQNNDILLTSKGRFSACVFQNISKDIFIASSGLFVIKIRSNNYIPEYVSLFLNSNKGQYQINTRLETMTIPSLTKESLLTIEIPDISIEEQKKLVNLNKVLFEYEALVNKKIDLCKKLIGVK